jgi:two-component system response regulator AtoC
MIERAVILSEGPLLNPEDFPVHGKEEAVKVRKGTHREIERDAVYTVRLRNDGQRGKSARELGISRRTLLNKIKEYGLIIHE